jgi:hypothetical protein
LQKSLRELYDCLYSQLIGLNPTFKQVVDEHPNKIMWIISDKIDTVRSEMNLLSIRFLNNHSKSFVSMKLLDDQYLTDQLSLDSLKKFYYRLDMIIQKLEDEKKL